MAKVSSLTVLPNSSANGRRMKTRTKKSNASNVQARKLARNVLRWVAERLRNSLISVMAAGGPPPGAPRGGGGGGARPPRVGKARAPPPQARGDRAQRQPRHRGDLAI